MRIAGEKCQQEMQNESVDWNQYLAGVAIIAYFYTPTLNTTTENRRRQKCKENNDFDHALIRLSILVRYLAPTLATVDGRPAKTGPDSPVGVLRRRRIFDLSSVGDARD
jgi:hypothetical protein